MSAEFRGINLLCRLAAREAERAFVLPRLRRSFEDARKWFRRYWTLGVGPGAQIVVNGVLNLTREIAEAHTATDR